MEQEIKFKLLSTRVRPPRSAVFINENDEHWQQSLLRIIERFSNYWGASNNLIIPTDGKRIKEEFWEILRHYRPDYLNIYENTWSDYKRSNPKEFEKIINEEVNNAILSSEEQNKEELYKMIEESFLKGFVQIEDFKLEKELIDKLIRELNPFYDRSENYIYNYSGFQNTNLKNILKNIHVDDRRIDDFKLKFNSPYIELLFRSYMGSSHYVRFNEDDFSVRDIINKKKINISYNIFDINEDNFAELISIASNNIYQTCYNLINKGLLKHYRNKKLHLKKKSLIVIGETLEDFCLFYSLKSLIDCVFWFPKSLLTNSIKEYGKDINRITRFWVFDEITKYINNYHFDNEIIITSFSLDKVIKDDIETLFTDWRSFGRRKYTFKFYLPKELKDLDKYSILLCEEQDRKNRNTELFNENISVNYFQTPIPKTFPLINAYDYNWVTDINIFSGNLKSNPKDGYNLCPLTIFNNDVFWEYVGDISSVRFTGECISYLCPNTVIFNSNIEAQTVTPRIKLLGSDEIFERIFDSIGYIVKTSDKGNYARESIKLYSSIEYICEAFLDESFIYKIYEQYLSDEKSGERKSKGLKGVLVNERTYLNYCDISHFIKNKSKTKIFIDDLIKKEILYKGYCLYCTRCKNSEWYSFKDIDEYFTCNRCKTKQLMLSENWKQPSQPLIYYSLNEVFYQGLKSNMKCPLLTLNYLKKLSESCFIFSPELELYSKSDNKKEIEIDIICISDGELLIGETKKNRELPKKLGLYNKIVNNLNAKFILSTYDEKWSEENIKKVNNYKWNKPLLFLTRKELSELA